MVSAFEKYILRITIVFFVWLTTLVLFAVQGWFNLATVVTISILAVAGFVLTCLWPRTKTKLVKSEVIALLVIIVICVFVGVWHHDFSLGRDPVSYFTAAVQVSETGGLDFHDELARPFHGLTQLGSDTYTSQFLPGYNVYLAIFFILGGVVGLWLANIPLLFLSLAAIYIIARRLSSKDGGLAAVLLTGTFYATIWFERRWTSENLLMLAILSAIACYVIGVRRRNLTWILLGLLPVTLALLVRGEGLLYLAAYVLATVIVLVWYRRQFKLVSVVWVLIQLPIIVFITFQLYVFKYGGGYIFGQGQSIFDAISGMLGKPSVLAALVALSLIVFILFLIRVVAKLRNSRINFWKLYWAILGIAIVVAEIVFWIWIDKNIPIIKWDFYRSQFVLEVFSHYLLVIFFVVIFIGFYKRVWQRLTYLVILLGLPAVVFILDPYIALDHPWFLRRFVAVFFPLIFILTAVALSRFKFKCQAFVLVVIILVAMNLAVASPILFYQEKDGAAIQLENLANKFSDDDIVLMTPGWKWQQWAYYLHFLYGTHVLPSLEGFENKQELLTLLEKYDNIYILSDRLYAYHPLYLDKQLELVDDITLEYPEIEKPLWGLSGILEESDGQVDVYDFWSQQSALPPRKITDQEIDLKLFQVK